MNVGLRSLAAALAAAAGLTGSPSGETLVLRDGSSLKGRLVGVVNDSLTFRTTVGVPVRLHRSQVLSILFDDSTAGGLPISAEIPVDTRPAVHSVGARGSIAVVFKDRVLSSKITIHKKVQWDAHIRSNWIVQELVVDGRVAYSRVDTTMDKPIYKGHDRQFKNEIELADITVDVPVGQHQCQLVVRNADPDRFREDFEPEPLNLVIAFDNVAVVAGQSTRLDVGIDRGRFRMGRPRLYRVE